MYVVSAMPPAVICAGSIQSGSWIDDEERPLVFAEGGGASLCGRTQHPSSARVARMEDRWDAEEVEEIGACKGVHPVPVVRAGTRSASPL